jgi:deoxyribose-phosphate aldolase
MNPNLTEAGRQLAGIVDHTLLRPEAVAADIERLCGEAVACGFAAVCVNPVWIETCRTRLEGSAVRVAGVVGFPLGASRTASKVFEARKAVEDGAEEIDMVMQIGWLREGRTNEVRADIAAVVSTAGCPVKVILETGLLTDDQKRAACRCALEAGAAYVKTATGFLGPGATVADIRLMRSAVGDDCGVKASGGIKTAAQALAMVEAGANRLGTSRSVEIVTGPLDGSD